MRDPSNPLQIALAAKIISANTAVGNRVYDRVPPNPVFPYVSLGDTQVLPDKADCIDGSEVYPIVNVWSRAVGYLEAQSISNSITVLLDDQPLTVPEFDVIVFEVQSVNYLRDPDGITRRASITFRGLLQVAS